MMPLRFAVIGRGRMAAAMRALIGDVPIDAADAVYIASRNRDHAAHARSALASGKAVLCEKPFAMTPAEAEDIISISQRSGLLYMEAVATPFLPAVATALQAADAGRLGAVRHLEASFGYPTDDQSQPRLFEPDGGVLADRAVYPLMLALIALGPVASASAEVERDRRGVDVAARFRLDHRNGSRSDLAVSFDERLDNSLRIEGDAGAVEVAPPLLSAQRLRFTAHDVRPSRMWRGLRQNGGVRRIVDLAGRVTGRWHGHGGSPYAHEVEHFTALFRSGAVESPLISHERMLAVARLIAEARQA
ncbi:Gfo/Idh/MocA family protein [Sphingomonas sp. SRS2]|uniref:Gfo/Idh/MocA family protein n=1 Tax=Sphingomonas sp. SRS2 TaxID=133190 RepID=UPI0006184E74|nr:Gfo/Idh/MocA family oxidoreductase [Sphingomonas sp. SRS2]KKC26165.1 oxidoreductase [Sphingomonas sp. SRS2]